MASASSPPPIGTDEVFRRAERARKRRDRFWSALAGVFFGTLRLCYRGLRAVPILPFKSPFCGNVWVGVLGQLKRRGVGSGGWRTPFVTVYVESHTTRRNACVLADSTAPDLAVAF